MSRYGLAIDLSRCTGCYACIVACKSENSTLPGVSWIRIDQKEQGEFPKVTRSYVPMLCMQCSEMPCAQVCAAGAILALFAGCGSGNGITPNTQGWWRDKVVYELFVRSFADSSGDGIGDLQGATAHLGDLSDLGVDAIWLMPVFPSPSYHGYDVTDYRAINPAYGTMAHSYVQAHDNEAAAFEHFSRSQPGNATLLIDTYDTERGISYWTKNYRTGIEDDVPDALSRRYEYYDPIWLLPEPGQRWWREEVAKGAA